MKRFVQIFFFTLLAHIIHGQDILNAETYKKGIYLNFEEFVYNAPSLTKDFELSHGKTKYHYELAVKDTILSEKFIKRHVWGVSTGSAIYVNTANYQESRGFTKLTEVGRYCILKDMIPQQYWVGGLHAGAPMTMNRLNAVVLNMNNGNFHILDNESVKLILESDSELIREYKRARNKGDLGVQIEYISKYNSLHSSELTVPAEPSPARLVIYRRSKKEKETLVEVTVNSRQVASLQVNDFVEISVTQPLNMKVCANEVCAVFSASSDRITYAECGVSEKSGPFVELVSAKDGEFYSTQVKYYKDKRTSKK